MFESSQGYLEQLQENTFNTKENLDLHPGMSIIHLSETQHLKMVVKIKIKYI